jgi:iron complex transport system substrate-binding protein
MPSTCAEAYGGAELGVEAGFEDRRPADGVQIVRISLVEEIVDPQVDPEILARCAMFILSLLDGRIMAAGKDTAADAMLTLARAGNVFSDFTGYKPVSAEAVLAAAPEAIVVMERYGPGPGPGVDVADVLADRTLSETPAGKSGRVVSMNGLYLLGFGPRTPHAARDLAAAIYPDLDLPQLADRPWNGTMTIGQ